MKTSRSTKPRSTKSTGGTKSTKMKVVEPQAMGKIEQVGIGCISPNPMNPRKFFNDDTLVELAQNILEHGILQPITIREVSGNGHPYEIVFGERRFRAARIAGLETIPCIISNMDDAKSFDAMISENLARLDIRPSEEANAFRKLIDKDLTISDISEKFGKSEKFIHSRLILNNLIPEISDMVDTERIGIGIGADIARYEVEIQADVYASHLNTDNSYSSWLNLPLKAFKERMERKYTTLLNRFPFDKSECLECKYNSELRTLFPMPEHGRCSNSACLSTKQQKHVVDTCLKAVNEETIEVCTNHFNDANEDVIRELNDLGVQVTCKDTISYPGKPQIPVRECFGQEEEFNQALEEYHCEEAEYQAKVAGIDQQVAKGEARKYIDISSPELSYCYTLVEADRKDDPANGNNNEDLLAKFRAKDKRNKEIAVEKTVEELKKLFKESEIQPVGLTDFEESLLYFNMLSSLENRHFGCFGVEEKFCLTDEEKFEIIQNMTPEQKNMIRRDYLLSGVIHAFGVSKKSSLLIELARLHFPDELAGIEHKHDEVYQKRRQSIEEKIRDMNLEETKVA